MTFIEYLSAELEFCMPVCSAESVDVIYGKAAKEIATVLV